MTAQPQGYLQHPNAAPQPAPSPAPPKRSGCARGCLYGCLTFVILLIAGSVGLYFAVPYLGRKLVAAYTDTKPADIPKIEANEKEVAKINQRVERFQQALDAAKAPDTLTLSADDINRLIASDPGWRKSGGNFYVTIDGDRIAAQFSIPFDELAKSDGDRRHLERFGLKGRYLNARGAIKVALRDGALVVNLDSAEVKGKAIPELVMRELRQKNLAEDLPRKNPELAEQIRKLDTIEVKDGQLILRSKGAEETPPPAP